MLLSMLVMMSLALTCTMFAKRDAMLGFPSAMFWFISGAQAFTLSTVPWGDIYFYLFFSCSIGMTVFTMFAAFGLREKHDALGDEEDEGGVSEYKDGGITKDSPPKDSSDDDDEQSDNHEELFYGEKPKPSTRTQKLRERAKARRTGG